MVTEKKGDRFIFSIKTNTVHTLGTSTRTEEEFMELLKGYHIEALIDVRRFPTSRWEHFKKENLRAHLQKEKIQYSYLGKELGGYRKGGYERYIKSTSFQEGIETLEKIAIKQSLVVVCAERLPWRCHRRFIAQVLQQRGWRVIHIIDKQRVWEEER